MTADSLITDIIVPLQPSDTGDDALRVMNDFYLRHLPVVKDGELVAVVSEDDVLEGDPLETVENYRLPLQPPSVFPDDHVYDVMKFIVQYKLTMVPVVAHDGQYIGMITNEDLLKFFAETSSFRDPGSIVILEMGRHDYSLSEIARIVESEGAIILSSFIRTFDNTARIEVTVKINNQSIAATLATFERYNYNVKASFNEKQLQDTLRERYDSLMNYLNV
ncbi:CBS domain-containing protein [Neolewinella antarctica]|uniref:CBS domain-containing protein n=1 Tax=Neolewinella antarctica TaxID=442734 RepID=A0ABX0XGG4_9BACT|nr:CBS domain-containing protein [Neolewinella antarctica]NJC28250.1 CBS domain-containing protein [Neolewinella antarctica]